MYVGSAAHQQCVQNLIFIVANCCLFLMSLKETHRSVKYLPADTRTPMQAARRRIAQASASLDCSASKLLPALIICANHGKQMNASGNS